MSDEGEKTCPLCAEEMDLTDQQLKPCKCGYEVCVWCWHHIMEMAEKNDSEGRCPACRAPYDKEKIVGMAANCERMVAEVNLEKKSKSQKGKTKITDGRKQLTSVRVIQRNLVYIVGLPLHLADEDLLQQRDYFGQYGKVLKVSMSRTSAGVIQQFPNNTCSVYITYSKEEEAVRCIQSVHGYVLEGRPLRVCFGTTKYCHAWLRNMPCTNLDCLYLHEVGSQEDSFTKDEIISAYTRTRVQQLTGNPIISQRRSGNVLPPPLDEYSSNFSASSGKPILKSAQTSSATIVKSSPPSGSNARPGSLPSAASWGTYASSLKSASAISNGHVRQKSDSSDGIVNEVWSTSAVAVKKIPINDKLHSRHAKGESESSNHPKQRADRSITDGGPEPTEDIKSLSSTEPCGNGTASIEGLFDDRLSSDYTWESYCLDDVKEVNKGDGVDLSDLSSTLDSVVHASNFSQSVIGGTDSGNAKGTLPKSPSSHAIQQQHSNLGREIEIKNAIHSNDEFHSSLEKKSMLVRAPNGHIDVEDDVLTFNSQGQKDPELVHPSTLMSHSGCLSHSSNALRSHSFPSNETFNRTDLISNRVLIGSKFDHNPVQLAAHSSNGSNGFSENFSTDNVGVNGSAASSLPAFELEKRWTGEWPSSVTGRNGVTDGGESTIISNILSLDIDALDDSLTSPHNLAKLLGETDEQPALKTFTSRKFPNSNQSRFSFARQDESTSQGAESNNSFNLSGLGRSKFSQSFPDSRDSLYTGSRISNGLHSPSFSEVENPYGSQVGVSPGRNSVSRSPMVAPPGFAVSSKAPPPGFSSHERVDNVMETSRNSLLNSSAWLSHAQQLPHGGNVGSTPDIEFIDPAILAVGKGRLEGGFSSPGLDLTSFGFQSSHFERDSRLQSMMQGSMPRQQHLRYIPGDNYSSMNGGFGISHRLLDQSSMGDIPSFSSLPSQGRNGLVSNGPWDAWNDGQRGDGISISQFLGRDSRLGLNKYSDGYEDSKFWRPSSGDLYDNKTFGV
ncbi:hypothetical protein MLD38_004001 [Melastoma candidum]|uniref:Uncharacterized protein n=1 Tax=Melastoma candidum TaxID=119954 RepID=A0ACB9S868_9MYRT|nr:hypothetical protein MLD38_004001 [Melastoma candidum]